MPPRKELSPSPRGRLCSHVPFRRRTHRRYFAPLAGAAGLGLKDDVALLTPPPGRDLVVTVDALVAGVHFFADDPPEWIAAKALRVNCPTSPPRARRRSASCWRSPCRTGVAPEWLEAFAAGSATDARAYGCPLLGGDTVETPGPLTLSITALGAVGPARMPVRTGARPGDRIYVRTIGDAALGLQLRLGRGPGARAPASRRTVDRYLLPQPRLGLGPALRHAHAAMDVSDGLVGDLAKMLRASGVSGALDLARGAAFRRRARLFRRRSRRASRLPRRAATIMRCSPPSPPARRRRSRPPRRRRTFAVRAIGEVEAGSAALRVVGLDGAPARFARGSYSHF